ncbi:MAG: hypothetical protein V1902_02985 [Candidatus Falkowbacteria bacterium]
MRYSNKQQLEQKYKEKLETAKLDDREMFELKKDMEEYKQDKIKKAGKRGRKNAIRFYCGAIFLVIFLAAVGLIFYFYLQIKDNLAEEFLKQKEALPQNVEQLQNTITDAQEKINAAYATYQEAKKTYEELKAIKNASVEKINQAKALMDQASVALENVKLQMSNQ